MKFHFYFLTAKTQNIHFMNVNRYVFDEFVCSWGVISRANAKIWGNLSTPTAAKTIYPDTEHVEIEPMSYLLKTKKEYDFVVGKLK